jgi:alpha-L-rhamnosidase
VKRIRNSALFFLCLVSHLLMAQPKAQWISPGFAEDSVRRPCPIFRKDFIIDKSVESATLTVTAHGLYEAFMDGRRVGDAWFTPGYTDYHRRLQYQQYEIGKEIKRGKNELRVMVGDGWYRGEYGADMKNDRYGKEAGLLLQLELRFADGSRDTIFSDGSWECTTGPIRYSNLYNGEVVDTRIDPSGWSPVAVSEGSVSGLVASESEPVKEHEHFLPVGIVTSPKGELILDFGQNLAGWVQVKVKGGVGDTIRLFHAEALDSAGNFYTGNLRLAKAEDVYVLNGERQTLKPHFTYHGFRYVKLEGYPKAQLKAENFTAIALYSDLEPAGHFACSDSALNQLQHNICWSQKSNFVDIPTDCPQRSERFGWAGDVQMFARTASFNQNVKAFFLKWLADLAAEQGTNGGLPVFIPDYRFPDSVGPRGGVAGWGDAATILPWTLFQVYGDTSILRRQYNSMKTWVDYVWHSADTSGLCWKAKGYGDWYAPLGPTDIEYIDQCFFIHSTELLIRAASVLGKTEDVERYTALREKIRAVFLSTYWVPLRVPNTQTACVLALQFDLLPDSLRPVAAEHLAGLIHDNGDHLGTGFIGTPYLLWVLTKNGYTDLAFTLLRQTSPPSWLYPLTKGATTIWEKWEAIRPDGTFDTCSLNHYAYGAVGDWLYRVVAGIDAASPGYRKISIQPHPGGGLTWVKADYQTQYGKIVSNWRVKHGKLHMDVVIPPNTTATVFVPDGKNYTAHDVGPGHYQFVNVITN